MQRIAVWLYQHDYAVRVIGRIQKTSKPFSIHGVRTKRIQTLFENGPFFYAVLNLRYMLIGLFSKANFLYSVDLDTLPGVKLAARISGKEFIWDCHEIFTGIPELTNRKFQRTLWTWIEKIFARNISKVLTVTGSVQNYLLDHCGLLSTVIHNYPNKINTSSLLSQKLDSKVILFQGAINQGRGLDILIQAMQFISQDYILHLAGEGKERPGLESLVRSLNLEDRIKFLGQLIPEELKSETDAAYMGISLLNSEHQNSYASLANKNLDYIMAGLPCITMNFPEYSRLNKQWEVAILLDHADLECVRNAIQHLITNKKLYEHLHLECLKAKEALNWEQESEKLTLIFRDIA